MHRLTLLCIGRLQTPWAKAAVAEYSERIARQAQFEVVELADSKEKLPERQVTDEADRLAAAAAKHDGPVWLLDERGDRLTSAAFAAELEKQKDIGQSVLFVLGGAHGLGEAIRNQATRSIRLSDMTLPHELCRVLFAEQLYRAQQIQQGTGYHH